MQTKSNFAPDLGRTQQILHGIVGITSPILEQLLDPTDLPEPPVTTEPPEPEEAVPEEEDAESDGAEWADVYDAFMGR